MEGRESGRGMNEVIIFGREILGSGVLGVKGERMRIGMELN